MMQSGKGAAQPALAKIVKYLAPDVWMINELGGNSPDYNSATMRNLLRSVRRATRKSARRKPPRTRRR